MNKFALLPLALATSLAWGSPPELTAAFERADALARAGANQESLALLERISEHEAAPVRALTLRVYLLSDSAQFAKALAAADAAVRAYPESAGTHLAKAYAQRLAGRPSLALLSYQNVLRVEPGNHDALQGHVAVLESMGSASLAWEEVQRNRSAFAPATVKKLQHAYAVELLKLHEGESNRPGARARLLDEAIALMRETAAESPANLADYLVVLGERGLHSEAVRRYEAAKASGGVGAWAELPVARSYSALGRYGRAVRLLEALHRAQPNELEVSYALIHAYSDNSQFDRAWHQADTLVASLARDGNEEVAAARQLQAQVRSWAGAHDEAGQLLEASLVAHPGHAGLKLGYAQWLASSGQPRLARDQLKSLLAFEPDHMEARLALLELEKVRTPRDAARELNTLAEKHPTNEQVQRVKADHDKSQRAYVYAATSHTRDRDATTTVTTQELVSPAFGPHGTRLHVEQRTATVTDGAESITAKQRAVGIQQPLGGDWQVTATAVQGADRVSGTGLRTRLTGHLSDHLRADLRFSTRDADLPARAHQLGTTARSAGAELHWSGWRGVNVSVSSAWQGLSDGNRRLSAGFSASGSMQQGPQWAVDWAVRLGADAASRDDVAYFSPRSAYWSEAELGLRTPSLRLFDRVPVALKPSAILGTYSQAGYATLPTYGVGLGSSWEFGGSVSLNLDARLVRRPYDGQYVSQASGQASLFVRLP